MRLSQLIEKLKAEGFVASKGRIRYALKTGYLCPLAEKVARGAFQFAHQHLAQLHRYFVHIRPGPMPDLAEELPLRGSEDRLHRMAQKKQLLHGQAAERKRRQLAKQQADATLASLEEMLQQLSH